MISDVQPLHGWLNIYKPRGISSAKLVSIIKQILKPTNSKIGHAGTLDVEAEGVLPLAVGEATKLVSILMNDKKEYIFTLKFGAKTDTADASGNIIETTLNIPNEQACYDVCKSFIGNISQVPPAYSAIKVGGVRSYKLAREKNHLVQLQKRDINIYSLKCLGFNREKCEATYIAECSKGTYIRTLAEDIALSLQSLAFVVRLVRTRVGLFAIDNSVQISVLKNMAQEVALQFLATKMLRIETVLNDISVLDANLKQYKKIKYGQDCYFDNSSDIGRVWVKYNNILIAIGSLSNNRFNSARVFNLI